MDDKDDENGGWISWNDERKDWRWLTAKFVLLVSERF